GPLVSRGQVTGGLQREVRGRTAAWGSEDRAGPEDEVTADAVAVRVVVEDDIAVGQNLDAGAQRDVVGSVRIGGVGPDRDGAARAGRGVARLQDRTGGDAHGVAGLQADETGAGRQQVPDLQTAGTGLARRQGDV